jgi:hypothetical protein
MYIYLDRYCGKEKGKRVQNGHGKEQKKQM